MATTMWCGITKLRLWLYVWLTVFIAIRCDKFMEEQGVTLRPERVKCKCVPSFCSVKCNVKLVSRERAHFNVLCKLFKTLNYIEYHVKTYYKHSNNEYRPMLLVFTGEFCKSYANHSPLDPLHIALAALGNTTNTNKPCPFIPGDYFVKDFCPSIRHWPSSFIPEGRFILNVTFYSQPNVIFANFEIYFEVTNRGILDLRV